MSNQDIKEAIKAGLKEFETRDLHKGTFLDPKGGRSVCLIGSIYMGMGCYQVQNDSGRYTIDTFDDEIDDIVGTTWNYLEQRLMAAGPLSDITSVPAFNDDESTTKEDVVLFMKEALHDLEDE